MSNGAAAGETVSVHTVPAGALASGALAFQTNLVAATQLAGQVFQVSDLSALNTFLRGNSPQQLADRLLLALSRWEIASADVSSYWDNATLNQNLFAVSTQSTAVATDAAADQQQAADQQAVSDHVAVVDTVFAQLAGDMDDFSDFGDN